MRRHLGCIALVWGLGLGAASAQPIAPKPSPAEIEVPRRKELVDPTKPSPAFEGLIQPKGLGTGPGAGPRMPTLVLRGKVVANTGPSFALLEVDGRYVVAGKDDLLPGAGSLDLKVVEISTLGVLVEVGTSKQMIRLK